ncbi:AAA family ATPase [uncultured Croceitalea sp.]|uniref:AAA family ATPase n=1 Tax=uncultured Croceitalea sp. TaxID=1798908 RepID=UPI0033066A01
MRYKKFIITGYRGLQENTEINISKSSILPIIGKNESGKTTCLEAIYCFDNSNDDENRGKHLNNIENLYSTDDKPVIITAEIEIDKDFNFEKHFENELSLFREEFEVDNPTIDLNLATIELEEIDYVNTKFVSAFQLLNKKIQASEKIEIHRNLKTKKYNIDLLEKILEEAESSSFAEFLVKNLPYTLYFDDFRDRIPEKLFITEDKEDALYSNWIRYINELFKSTKEGYSVYTLPDTQDSKRRSIIREVEKHLNKRLLEEWSKYQFENANTIEVKIDYSSDEKGSFLQFKIVEHIEVDGIETERFFDIADRSKGFYWYFNFMVKLCFNPSKRKIDDKDTVYLLDEPGSYLHTFALNKLAEQIKNLSINNKVIYCTHSHNLLNPNFIPINSIHLAEKTNRGVILLSKLNHKGIIRPNRNSAYQPIYDALEVRPPITEYDFDNVVLLEGIYDYYSFKMFTDNSISYFPCASASSINNQIPYMIFLGKKYVALWDNDGEGRARLEKGIQLYGSKEGEKFITLDNISGNDNSRLEDYYEEKEVELFNNEKNGKGQSFEKTVLSIFYSSEREDNIQKYFSKTKLNFSRMEKIIKEKLLQQNSN